MFRTAVVAGMAICALSASPARQLRLRRRRRSAGLHGRAERPRRARAGYARQRCALGPQSRRLPPEYPGQEPSLHRWRITPEFSLGLTHQFELGLYLPLATIAPDGTPRAEGAKARIKWLAPHGEEGFYWGANVEIGRVAHALDQNPWNGELKLIGGWRRGRWAAAVNGNIDFVISGPTPGPATLQLASKLGYRIGPATTLGIESYNGMGPLRSPGNLSQNEHATYLAVDTKLGRWDINAGIGRGYGANADQTIVKLVTGVPIGQPVER